MIAQTVQDHLAIVAAMQARDADAARQAMLAHLAHVEYELEQLARLDHSA
jgi:DNA-binding FadR family transcriptional regulator